ncbi:MAG: YbjQ family protein [SAR86 cluster bacterium]|nr:YbjQ family protein [SAR86 cluster bacterium]MDG1948872.1 YbjQ family protein [SAR86 cluster bacterium]MDG2091672.1 YbjQ family protein [SAR86 cluster bacterium]|tara:strand:- start:249 stop:590 length:342 start_codon:yes stop_codon:yes gene_type:complete
MREKILVVTSNEISGYQETEHLGIVQGSTVKSRNFLSDFLASLKTIIGGELVGYSKLLASARSQAYDRMLQEAEEKNADAIVSFRFQTSSIAKGASEILAYGTAIKIKGKLNE